MAPGGTVAGKGTGKGERTTAPATGTADKGPTRFFRATVTDAEVMDEVVKELGRRNVDLCGEKDRKDRHHVALVGEWDTPYARALPYTFAASATGKPLAEFLPQNGQKPKREIPDWIHTATYLRGLDGRARGEAKPQGAAGGGGGGGEPAEKEDPRPAGKKSTAADSAELSEGTNQTDYLRRLADDLEETDRQLVRETGEGIKAVGVLGSDLYDKLLILRALRPRLRAAVFFTTVLDARYTLSEEWRAAHNLVVVTGYGLSLHPDFQKTIPPFRDSNQTAYYATTLFATGLVPFHDDAACMRCRLGDPRVFEIGRGQAFDLTVNASTPPELSKDVDEPKGEPKPISRGDIHPPRPDLADWWTGRRIGFTAAAVALTIGAVTWILCFVFGFRLGDVPVEEPGHVRRAVARAPDPRGLRRRQVGEVIWILLTHFPTYLALAVVATVALVWRVHRSQVATGEPFSMFGGVSVWPTDALRILAGLLCFHFLLRVYRRTRINDREIEKHFCLRPEVEPHRSRWWRVGLGKWDVLADGGKRVDAKKLWMAYRSHGQFLPRLWRSFFLTVAYFGVIVLVMLVLGKPTAPCRGACCRRFDLAASYGFSVPVTLFLTFFVLDATIVNRRFIKCLADKETVWPKKSFGHPRCRMRGMMPADLRDYLDIRLIAERTEAVGEIIYYPFLVSFLLIASRSSLFDNWDWPAGVVVVYGLSTLLAISSAVLLRRVRRGRPRKGGPEPARPPDRLLRRKGHRKGAGRQEHHHRDRGRAHRRVLRVVAVPATRRGPAPLRQHRAVGVARVLREELRGMRNETGDGRCGMTPFAAFSERARGRSTVIPR